MRIVVVATALVLVGCSVDLTILPPRPTSDASGPAIGDAALPECVIGFQCDGDAGCRPLIDHTFCDFFDFCDPIRGCVAFVNCADDLECRDDNLCNGQEVCDLDFCSRGSAPRLDDGDPCTADGCSPLLGITHRPIAGCPPDAGARDAQSDDAVAAPDADAPSWRLLPVAAAMNLEGVSETGDWAVGWTSTSASIILGRSPAGSWNVSPGGTYPWSELSSASAQVSGVEAWTAGRICADAALNRCELLTLRWDGHAWSRVVVPSVSGESFLTGIAMAAPGEVWATGEDRGAMFHFTGGTWSLDSTAPIDPRDWLVDLTATSIREVWAAGVTSDRSALAMRWDGTAWSRHDLALPGSRVVALGAGQGEVFAAVEALLLRWTPAGWIGVDRVPSTLRRRLAVLSPTEIYAVDDFFRIQHWMAGVGWFEECRGCGDFEAITIAPGPPRRVVAVGRVIAELDLP